MRISKRSRHLGQARIWRGLVPEFLVFSAIIALLCPSSAQGVRTVIDFAVVGSQFRQRDHDDAGEARICIRNGGQASLSMAQLKVRVLARASASPGSTTKECRCLYAKLSPPVLGPGQYGEIVAKLSDRPPDGLHLACEVSASDASVPRTTPLTEPALWIAYVGFSEDLRDVFVYVENTGREPVEAELLAVGHFRVAGGGRAVQIPVPPADKGCLAAGLPEPLSPGQFVHVVVDARTGQRESQAHAVPRAIRAVPIAMEGGTGDPRLGLDVRRLFLQTMICPAHAHGTHEEAAAKFLGDYAQRFTENPDQVIQMAICRADMPRAWFRFGNLPDVAAMNPFLRPPPRYNRNPDRWFCPFFCVGEFAKRAAEPGRYLAIMPTGLGVKDRSFLLEGVTPQEERFLVYCALASGAKGVIYRGMPPRNPLGRDAFRQLNGELQHLRPLLLIAEPVDWALAAGSGYAARSLLCGDRAVLVMVFNDRYFSRQKEGRFYTPTFDRAMTPVRVRLRIPDGMSVRDLRTPFASVEPGCWEYRNGALDLTTAMVDSAQVYVASLEWDTPPAEGGQPQ